MAWAPRKGPLLCSFWLADNWAMQGSMTELSSSEQLLVFATTLGCF